MAFTEWFDSFVAVESCRELETKERRGSDISSINPNVLDVDVIYILIETVWNIHHGEDGEKKDEVDDVSTGSREYDDLMLLFQSNEYIDI